MMSIKLAVALTMLFVLGWGSLSAHAASGISVIPKPSAVAAGAGNFALNAQTVICAPKDLRASAEILAAALRPATGYPIAITSDAVSENALSLLLAPSLEKEGYRLEVTDTQVTLSGGSAVGVFYGIQTLRQLFAPEMLGTAPVSKDEWEIPCARIEDSPRFAWRGAMIDVARHFMPVDSLKKFIDVMALHKMNSLQLHLTDDQGWRIEIKKYPKLTEVGAWRKETVVGHAGKKPWKFDGKKHGGFYSQDELRDLVAYAAERHITIMPEVELPGHAQAAIASYPELGNLDEKLPVHTSWGVNKNIYNPKESTILFLQDVLSEVLDIFPSAYIHIGGDEAVKDQWEASEAVQARIKELGLKDEHEMQAYVISRMNDFLAERGRRLIGWDEILEGGLAKGATVMAWRGEDRALEAVRKGYDVVNAWTRYTYLDYYQGNARKEPLAIGGNLPLEKVYQFDPVPKELTKQEAKHILGAQTQLWTEYIATPEHLEYMAFPRACAIAEVVWTPQAEREYDDFEKRLKTHVQRLEVLGVKYRALD
jgi:hexosaminidase